MVGNVSAEAGLAETGRSNGAAQGQLPVYSPGDKVLCEATFEQAGRERVPQRPEPYASWLCVVRFGRCRPKQT